MRALVIAILLAPVVAQAQPSDVLAKVQAYYASSHDSVRFRHSVNGTTRDGTLLVGAGHRFRVDYLRKERWEVVVTTSVVDDGTDLWVIDRDARRITKDPEDDIVHVAVAVMAQRDLAAHHQIAYGPSGTFTQPGVVLELTPDPMTSYRQLLLLVEPSDGHVTEALVVDAVGDWHEFRFVQHYAAESRPTWFAVNPATMPGFTLVVPVPTTHP